MDYFPTFIKVKDKTVLVIGGTEDALHKVRLLRKSSAKIIIFGAIQDETLQHWADEGVVVHNKRSVSKSDLSLAAFAYIGSDDDKERDHAIALFNNAALPYSVIDDKERSSFITPALVDRDPVVIAIGTEGTGPIIARDIKARIEAELPSMTGVIAKVAGAFRPRVDHLPHGSTRRKFWQRYLDEIVPFLGDLSASEAESYLEQGLEHLLAQYQTEYQLGRQSGPVSFHHQSASLNSIWVVNTAAENPDLLTRQALTLLHDADFILYHHQTPIMILELTRREASKMPWGQGELSGVKFSWVAQQALNGKSVVVMTPSHELPFDEASLAEIGIALKKAAFVQPNPNSVRQIHLPKQHDNLQQRMRGVS